MLSDDVHAGGCLGACAPSGCLLCAVLCLGDPGGGVVVPVSPPQPLLGPGVSLLHSALARARHRHLGVVALGTHAQRLYLLRREPLPAGTKNKQSLDTELPHNELICLTYKHY